MNAPAVLVAASLACFGSGIGALAHTRPVAGFVWAIVLFVVASMLARQQNGGPR